MRSSIYVVLFSLLMLVASAFAQEDADEALPSGDESALEQEEAGDDESSGEEAMASDEESQSSDEEAAAENTSDPYANTTKGKISRDGKNWLLNGEKVEEDIVVQELNSNSKSASEYRTYQVFYYPGMALAVAGGVAVGYGAVTWIMGDGGIGMPVTLAGVGVVGIGAALYYVASKYFDSSIQIYNREAGYETTLKLQIVPTQQGGLALALAF